MSLDDCLNDPALFDRLLHEMANQRSDTDMTPPLVHDWHARLRACTQGAIDDPAQSTAPLRELRRYLCTLAHDARLLDLAQQMVDWSCPPDLAQPPRHDLPPADDDERVAWRNLRAMVLEARGDLSAARAAYIEAADDFATIPQPQMRRFAILTNAAMSSYELGDDLRGARYLARAEEIAQINPTDDGIETNLALARLFPSVFAGDLPAFEAELARARGVLQRTDPNVVPTVDRFAALCFIQLGAPDRAKTVLPPLPAPDAPPAVLTPDTMVRLQVQLALGPADAALVDRALLLMGRPESVPHDWALYAVLAEALFAQGQIAPAMICATLLLRNLHTLIETMPQRRGVSMDRRRSILAVFTALQRVLVSANYLRAAENLAGLHQRLLQGVSMTNDFRNWAPDARLAQLTDQARVVQAQARAGTTPPESFGQFLRAQRFTPAPEALPPSPPDSLRIAFLPHEGTLVRVVQRRTQGQLHRIVLGLPDIADLAQRVHRRLSREIDADADLLALGDALFAGLTDDLATAHTLDILPFGPVAALPFAALNVQGARLGETHRLRIHTGQIAPAPPAQPPTGPQPGAALRVAFALGVGLDALSSPRDEAHQIARLHGQDPAPLREFDRAALEAMLAEHPRILHIGAHFKMVESNLEASELIAAQGQKIPLSAVFNRALDLRGTDLVFLAGCDSAGHAGTDSFAAQLVGLGARHVIAALWPVVDGAAQALAVATHAALARGAPPVQALAEAQARLRADPRFAAPRHWAAFQCYCA